MCKCVAFCISFDIIPSDSITTLEGIPMINAVKVISGVCGSGKSVGTSLAMRCVHELAALQGSLDVTIFASKTIELSHQNHSNYVHMISLPDGKSVAWSETPTLLIDSELSANVNQQINEAIAGGFKGVIFTTHAALEMISEHNLNRCDVFVDEVPDNLAHYMAVKHTDSFLTRNISEWVDLLPIEGNNDFQLAKLKPCVDKEEVLNLVNAVRTGKNTAITAAMANILEFLVLDYSVMYYSAASDDTLVQYFHAVKYHALEKVIKNAKSLHVLAANVDASVFGYVCERVLNTPLELTAYEGRLLKQKHNHKVTIVPFLIDGEWSNNLKQSVASDKLDTDSEEVVANLIQKFSLDVLGSDFLMFHNKDDVLISDVIRADVTPLLTQVHGMNNYRHIDKASFIASLRPSPYEEKVLRLFEKEIAGTDKGELYNRVVTGRCYEAAYQCCLRTGLRNHEPNNNEFVLVVPDMKYANYIAERFEDGCVTIDTSKGYKTKTAQKRAEAKDNRLDTVVAILTDKKNKVAKMPELLTKYGIHRNSFNNYKKEFKAELQALGLVK